MRTVVVVVDDVDQNSIGISNRMHCPHSGFASGALRYWVQWAFRKNSFDPRTCHASLYLSDHSFNDLFTIGAERRECRQVDSKVLNDGLLHRSIHEIGAAVWAQFSREPPDSPSVIIDIDS